MKTVLSMLRSTFLAAALLAGAGLARAQVALTAATVGQSYSYQVTTNPAPSAGTLYGATGLPTGLTINTGTGLINGTPTTAGTSTGQISLTSNGVTNNFSYSLTVNGATGTPAITSAATASGTVNVAGFSFQVTASNSPTSFNFSGVPPGLAGDTTSGSITGTPTRAGTYAVSVSGNNGTGTGNASTLTITIAPAASAPVITSATTAGGNTTTTYTSGSPLYSIVATNSPTSYGASGLPGGLALDSTTGLITGTPAANGVYTVALTASNGAGTGATVNLTVTIGSLPLVTTSAAQSATVNSAVSLQLASSPSATSYNVSGLPPGLSASAGGLISGTPTSAGTYTSTVSGNNSTGTGPSVTLTFTVASPSVGGGGGGGGITILVPPTLLTQPASQTVNAGATATFTVAATGGTLTYQWLFNGTPITGATSATLTLTNVQTSAGGSYTVAVSNGITVTSSPATLTVQPATVTVPLAISAQPVSQTVTVGASVTLSVAAAGGSGPITYQWFDNGVAVSGATASSLTITNAQAASQGSYTVVVSSGAATVTSSAATITVTVPAAPARLVNVSLSGISGQGGQPLVVGLSIGGSGTKTTLLRAVGPTLASFGLGGVMADPQLALYNNSSAQIAANDNWGGSAALSAAFASTGAFALPANSKDAVLLVPLAGGTYSARVGSSDGSSGLVLLEAYDADGANPTARFLNLSALANAGSGANVVTIGFIVGGTGSKTFLIRGIGPTLATFGLGNVLPATKLTLFSGQGSAVVAANSGWGGSAALAAAFAQVNAFALPANSLDSAMVVTLAPGSYSAQLTGATASQSGSAIIELYDMGQ